MGTREIIITQLLDDFKEKGRYANVEEEALDRTVWRTFFGRGWVPSVRLRTNE
jgi:hypothetical protein